MPMPLEPGGTCAIVLDADKGKPNPPTFIFPFLSGRQQARLMRAYEFCEVSGSGAPMDIGALFAPLKDLIVDWHNIDIPFDADELDAVISVAEAYELINKLVLQGPTAAEKN